MVWVDRSDLRDDVGSWMESGFAHERIECYMPRVALKKFRDLNDSLDRAGNHCIAERFRVETYLQLERHIGENHLQLNFLKDYDGLNGERWVPSGYA